MRIVSAHEGVIPISSSMSNAFIDFSTMDCSVLALVSDVVVDGEPVVGYGFSSNGRYSAGEILRRRILPRLLDGFLARYPGIALEVNMDNTFIDVIGAGYDAGIRYEESLAKDMIAIPIGPRRQCFMAVAAPSYLQRHGTPQHPSELSEHRLLGYRFASGKLGVWEFEQEGRTLRIAPEGRLVSSSQDLLIAAACAGHGILYTFEEYIAAHLASGQLQPILQDWWQHFEGPYLYYHSRRHVPAPLRAFVDYVKALNDSGHPSPSPK